MRSSRRDFLKHYKRLTIFFVSLYFFTLQNTRLSFESIVCYTLHEIVHDRRI